MQVDVNGNFEHVGRSDISPYHEGLKVFMGSLFRAPEGRV